MYSCESVHLTHLPKNVPPGTQIMLLKNNSIIELCGRYPYLRNVTHLNLAFNHLTRICESFFSSLSKGEGLKFLDISYNKLSGIPVALRNKIDYIHSLKIGSNDFYCDCNMIWMKSWLEEASNSVEDIKDVKCQEGLMIGTKISKLKDVKMGCYPKKIPDWGIALMASFGAFLVIIGLLMFITIRKWQEVKFWLYKNFDIIDKRDLGENLDGKKFDALISYRYGINLIKLFTTIL